MRLLAAQPESRWPSASPLPGHPARMLAHAQLHSAAISVRIVSREDVRRDALNTGGLGDAPDRRARNPEPVSALAVPASSILRAHHAATGKPRDESPVFRVRRVRAVSRSACWLGGYVPACSGASPHCTTGGNRSPPRRRRAAARELAMPEAGIEPAQSFPRRILSPVRLPIPPLRRRPEGSGNQLADGGVPPALTSPPWRKAAPIVARPPSACATSLGIRKSELAWP
jgi:hypothetical protein